jgi:tetratricopeptide (TPR) repeat protein
VSLLLDALKRAEQEKLARHGERGFAGSEAANAPLASSPAGAASALELQPLGSTPEISIGKQHSAAQAAQVVFQAKVPAAEPARGKAMLWVGIAAIVIVVMAAATYVWYSISALTAKPVVAPRVRPTPIAPPASGFIPPANNTPSPSQPAATLTPEAAPPPPAPKKTPAPSNTEQLVMSLLRDSPVAAAPPVKLSRTVEGPKIPGDVAAGYQSLRSGNLAQARRSYQSAVAADAGNVDAQLGLATVEARMGDRSAAALHYRKTLEVDPRNATAIAGLASLADFARPETLEQQLREDLARYPQSAALHFALGNVYAAQSRWREAQGEFFEAHRLEPGGADTLFNLAVSLDNMGQGKLAADYYARALEASKNQSTQFDPAPVARRLAELRP